MLEEKKNQAVELTDDDLDQATGGTCEVQWKKRSDSTIDETGCVTNGAAYNTGNSQSGRLHTNRYRA
jgi:hypothetical protein